MFFWTRSSELWRGMSRFLPGGLIDLGFPTVVVGDVQFGFHLADGKTPQGVGGTVPYCGVDLLIAAAKKFVDGGAAVYRGPLDIEGGRRIC